MTIGLTGGMGCGKTTAARIFEEFGFRRVDTDALVRDRVLTSPDIIAEARHRFGNATPPVITPAGQIDRPSLARVLFADETGASLRAWETLVHPRVHALWRATLAATPDARWIIEVPLLHEKSLEKWFDFIVCVASSTATQYARLAQRGVAHTLATQRISRQMPLSRKIDKADYVLSNDGTVEHLRDQIRHLLNHLPTAQTTN